MKKIALVLALILCVSSMAMAAAAPAKKAAAAPTGGFTGVSLNNTSFIVNAIGNNIVPGVPTARIGMGSFDLEVGGVLINNAGASTTVLLAKAEMPLANLGNNTQTYWAPVIGLCSSGGTSITYILVLLGCEYKINPNLAIFADMNAFMLQSMTGTTNWQIGGNVGQIYTGGRLYF